jgi:toxin YoeB
MMDKNWHYTASKDYKYWISKNKKKAKKINDLIKSIEENGYKCMGKPEPLKGSLSGWWSVRIDPANRLIFKINENSLEILSCKGHYD